MATKRNDPKKRPVPEVVKKPAASAARPAASAARPAASAAKAPPPRAPAPKRGPARGGRDDARASRDRAPGEAPAFVGGPRNEFGTRVARRITCSRCQSVDHVPWAPKDPSRALCRACAAQVLKTYEVGTKVRMPTRDATCNLCGKPFQLPVAAEDDGDPLCLDCLRGFTTWQGAVETPWTARQETVVETRVGGALVRRRKERA